MAQSGGKFVQGRDQDPSKESTRGPRKDDVRGEGFVHEGHERGEKYVGEQAAQGDVEVWGIHVAGGSLETWTTRSHHFFVFSLQGMVERP